MLKIIVFRILIISTTISFGQNVSSWNSKRDKIKIPFELSHNLIIVDVVFNGVNLKMIADTGASKSIVFSLPNNESMVLKETNLITITGAGISEKVEGYLSKNNTLEVGKYRDSNFEAIFVFDRDISLVNRLGIPINGILGSSFFKDYLIELDYQRMNIILHKSNKLKKKDSYAVSKIEINNDRPYIYLNTIIDKDEINLKLLYDTGLSDGLWLFENDSLKCNSYYFEDYLGKGLSGDIYGKKSRVKEVKLEGNLLSNVLVSYPEKSFFDISIPMQNRNGFLGGEVIKRFNWILDYENQKVYFKKNSLFNKPFEYNMAGIEVQHSGFQFVKEKVQNAFSTNVISFEKNTTQDTYSNYFKYELKPNFEIYSIRKNSPAALAGLEVGDIILRINNYTSHNLSIQRIVDLFHSKEGKQITIQVSRKGVVKTFKFNLEKIL